MKVLIIWLCASAAMDDCQVHRVGEPMPPAQCETTKEVYANTLGTGAEQNYRIECKDA